MKCFSSVQSKVIGIEVAVSLLLSAASASAAALTLSFAASAIAETQITNATTAKVTLSSKQTNDVMVSLRRSTTNELYVPNFVTIPAGSDSVVFEVGGVNNPFITGPVNVTLVAKAKGFIDGSASITVLDDDLVGNLTLGGHFVGRLTNNTYHVTDDLTVDFGQTLVIDPGSELRFRPGTAMTNAGTLRAIGTKDAYIRFVPANASPTNGDWAGLIVTGPNTALGYVEIAFGQYGLRLLPAATHPALSLSNSLIHDCSNDGVGLIARSLFSGDASLNGKVLLFSNAIYRNGHDGVYLFSFSHPDGNHFCASSDNAAVLAQNRIYDNGGAGVEILVHALHGIGGCQVDRFGHNSSVISNNVVYGNGYGIYGYAENFSDWIGVLRTKIVNNLIASNAFGGVWLSGTNQAQLKPVVVNNTIANNGNSGIFHWVKTATGFVVENNLVIWNKLGVTASAAYAPTNASIAGNDVWGNAVAGWFGYPTSFGSPVAANINGTPQDANANIAADPLFVSSGDFRLRADSPAIDAGLTNNAPTNDIAGAGRHRFPDLGSYEFSLLLTPVALSQGRFTIVAAGGRGTPFELQSSTNLTNWSNSANLVLTNRSVNLPLSLPADAARIFYRGRIN